MKNRIVEVPAVKEPIRPCPGFVKKELADYKLDLMALCGFGCTYCSSNWGNYLRINRKPFAKAAAAQLGVVAHPHTDPDLAILWPDVLERLEAQLSKKRPGFGTGKTLVFSMLTDGFSPVLVKRGVTEAALRLVLDRTSFRIRVLTKNSVVGSDRWIRFFLDQPGRFVVGLSTGTMDDNWARKVELNTSKPTARLAALRRLQDAGVPTYGMLCPVFPDMLDDGGVERLVEAVRPDAIEHLWAEPFNDRTNWRAVRDGYELGSPGYRWLTEVYGDGRKELWSLYAADLYGRLRVIAGRDGWLPKLRYLLYEGGVDKVDAGAFEGLNGVLLQSKPDEDGKSKNSHIANLQNEVA